ncbi:MAG: hypothetical protein MZV64_49190 [Ignavibacteriales bacterium]|nr:hypothetical protein [Ignavibacteriales bacterium]
MWASVWTIVEDRIRTTRPNSSANPRGPSALHDLLGIRHPPFSRRGVHPRRTCPGSELPDLGPLYAPLVFSQDLIGVVVIAVVVSILPDF